MRPLSRAFRYNCSYQVASLNAKEPLLALLMPDRQAAGVCSAHLATAVAFGNQERIPRMVSLPRKGRSGCPGNVCLDHVLEGFVCQAHRPLPTGLLTLGRRATDWHVSIGAYVFLPNVALAGSVWSVRA